MDHTPGPWKANRIGDYHYVIRADRNEGLKGNYLSLIADVHDDGPNARLIALSPTMFDLLKKCHNFMAELIMDDETERNALMDEIWKTIKAEGKQMRSIALALAFWLLASVLMLQGCAAPYKYTCHTDTECQEEEALRQYAFELDLDRIEGEQE